MPFQPGNTEATKRGKDRRFRAALMRYADADPKRLDELAEKLWATAMSGETAAIKELVDRLDGKVPQAIVGDDEHPPVSVTWESPSE